MDSTATGGKAWPELQRARRAIVVVDVVESVRLMQAHEADVIDRWRRFVNEVRTEVLPKHGGRLVKSLGDGMLLEFASAPAAVAATLDLQSRAEPYNQGRMSEAAMWLRAGIHVADVVVDELDLYGSGVNLAARLATLAGPREIVVSALTRDQLTEGLDADVEDLGECHLRNLVDPVHAYRVGPAPAVGRTIEQSAYTATLAPAVAVIPLVPLGEASAELGEMLADGVIAQLSRSTLLTVISRLSCSALKARGLTVAEIAAMLNAAYVVTGVFATNGMKLVVDIEVCEARTQRVVCAERFDAAVGDLTSARSEPINAIADAIQRSVIERELSAALQHPLPTLSSYSLFLAAISLMHRASRVEFERSRDMLDHLVDRHRRVPAPRAWLAQWYVLRMTRGWSAGPSADASEALEQTRRAIDIDPSCSLAYTMAGFVQCHLRKDLDSADQLYRQALDANPNESLAWLFISVLHTFKGEGEAALTASERALSLSPLDPLRYYYHSLAASAAVAAGRYDRAIELARRAIKSNRTHTSTYRALAMAQALSGREADAHITAAQLLALDPTFTVGRFLERSPSAQTSAGALYAAALRAAGVPD